MSNAPTPAPADELLEHGDGLMELDRSWVIVRVNAAQERATGKPRSETLGRVFWDVWPPVADPASAQRRAYRRCMEERVPVELQDYYPPFGTWFHITAYPTSTGGIAVFFRDVTEQKRAERSVRAERDFSTAILDTLASLVVVLDTDGRIVRFNAACERATGFGANEVVERSVFELLIPEADLPGTQAAFRQLRMGDFPNRHRNRWRMRDGTERLLDWSNTAIADEHGAIQFIIATGIDITDREKSLERLRDSEERFRSVFDSAAVGIGRIALDGRFLQVNDAYASLLGYGPAELLRTSFQTVTHPDDLAKDVRQLADLIAGRIRSYRMDKRYLRKDGSTIWVSLSVGLARDAAGRPAYCAVVVEDIGARREAEEALRQNEQRLRAIFDDAAIGIVEVDEQDRFLAVNRAFCRMLGYTRQELLGRTLHDITAAEDRAVTRELNAKVHAGELREFEYEKRYLKRDGSKLCVQVNVRVVKGAGGRFVRAVATAQDITERKRAEAALRESEAKFRSVFEQAAIGMGRVRFSDARWIDVNDAFCRMLGRTQEEMLRTPWPEITHPDDLELDLVSFRRMSTGALESYTVEKRFIHAHGHDVWARLTLSLVRDGSGKPDYEIAIIEDIGDRKRAEEALRDANARLVEADRRKDEFLGMLSHELRNPLAPIRNSLFILDHAEPTGQQARRAKEIARRQVAHMTRLVDDLLDVTRIARGKMELRKSELDLSALARRTVDDHRPLMHDRGLELELVTPPTAAIINGDETRLAQVLGNLLHNASKFTPPGGRVTLTVGQQDGKAIVHVRDTGVGMDAETLQTIFEPFVQGKQTIARSEGGLGLGLALVKGLVAMHGGEVTAGSAGRGRGTEVVITLPLDRRQAVRAHPPSGGGERSATARRRILVVDDNQDAAESLAQLLELGGHEVAVAYDGPGAVAAALASRPDVVLCDIGLPGMDGYEVARRLRAAGAKDIRLVAVSGYAQPEDVARAAEAGYDAHVAKPPDPEQIAHLLH